MNLKVEGYNEKLKKVFVNEFEKSTREKLKINLLEDIEQSYIINEQNNLLGVIKKNNIIEGLDRNKIQTLILIGISGLKYLEEQLLELPLETQILIIEENNEYINLEINKFDFSQLFDRDITIYNKGIDELTIFFNTFFTGTRLYRLGNLVTFIGDMYINTPITKTYINTIKKSIANKLYSLGNSIQDSLIGVQNNMENIEWFKKSKSVSELKDRFKDIPAIIVAAGPSIEKNINYIKDVQNKYVIIAVDTIVSRLLQEGIIPHFICSVERIEEVYTYFYKDKNYPKEITLVGPSLLRTEIFENFSGEKLLPLRKGVGEYIWLSKMLDLNEDDFAFMGISCAHMAFGIGEHLGCSPLVLVGQDLAFGEEGNNTHASGTIYDKGEIEVEEYETTYEVAGYNGGNVKTNEIWIAFKDWYERYIIQLDRDVINATEGGAKIQYTKQMALKDVIDKYPGQEINVYEIIKNISVCKINMDKLIENFGVEKEYIKNLNEKLKKQVRELYHVRIYKKNGGNLEKIRKRLLSTDVLLNEVLSHPLLAHLYQSHVVVMMWKYYKLELKVSEETIRENINIHKGLLEPIIFTNNKVMEYLEGTIKKVSQAVEGNRL